MLRLLRNCEVALKQLQHSLEGVRPSRAGPSAGEIAHLHGTVRSSPRVSSCWKLASM